MIKICKYKGKIGYYDSINNIFESFTSSYGHSVYMRPKEQPIEITDCENYPTLKLATFNSQGLRHRRIEEE